MLEKNEDGCTFFSLIIVTKDMKNLFADKLQIILDFDGVIADTNGFKARNILEATKKFVSLEEAIRFQQFFIKNNGVPREAKVNGYFGEGAVAQNILSEYLILNTNLVEAPLVKGIRDFLEINKDKEIVVLSGGIIQEISEYLNKKDMIHYFKAILCGPQTKEQNLDGLTIKSPCVYIGDALHDYEISVKFSLDFIFLYGYTQFYEWIDFPFGQKVKIFKDFEQIINNGKN